MLIKKVQRCVHCGEALQSEDPNAKGYLSFETKGKEGETPLLCSACFERIGWNDEPTENAAKPSYLAMLEEAKKGNPLFLYVIDSYSFESSFVNAISRLLLDASVLVLGNKRDLLPKALSDSYLSSYIAARFQEAGMTNVKPSDVFLTSIHGQEGLEEAKAAIDKLRKGRDVFLVGCSKSGKTLLINSFLASYRNKTKKPIFRGPFKNTLCNVLEIPLDDSSKLYDTPGFSNDNSVFGRKEPPREIMFEEGESVANRSLSLERGGSVFVGLLAHFDCLKTDRKSVPVHCFFPPRVELKRITPKKDIPALFDKYLEKKALRPRLTNLRNGKDFDAFEFAIEQDEEKDFGIAGLGWINVEAKKGEVYHLYLPKGIGVSFSDPKIRRKGI